MNAVQKAAPLITQIHKADVPGIGTAIGGGYCTGLYRRAGLLCLLITAPKAMEIEGVLWAPNRKMVEGARSLVDGMGNTIAMADAGIKTAQDILASGDGWCIPALDQAELQYRAFKPTNDENYCVSGCNISAEPPTQRYSLQDPAQTAVEAFRAGGPEAFETRGWYGTSSEYAGYPDCAWFTGFGDGNQDFSLKLSTCRARPVRDLLVIS